MERALESLERLARLPLRWACSGHGQAIDNPATAIDSARRRYESWLHNPHKLGWHACKRIFAYALMIYGGLAEAEVEPYLLRCGWFQDYSRSVFGLEPIEFVQPLLAEMLRSGAAEQRSGRLVARAPYTPPAPGWLTGPARPRDWPPAGQPGLR